jgi:lysophospholipase L1-like esterase
MSFARRSVRIAGFILLQLVIALALVEIVLRIFNPLGVSYFPEILRYTRTYILEEPIGYRHRPGLKGKFWGVPVEINSIGLRDREVGAKAPGEYRILVMGDSMPFGIGVTYEDSFPHQLQMQLNKKYPGRDFRTINMGVPSYNTEQELIQLETLGLSLKPDAVMLMFMDNDIQAKKGVRELGRKRYEVLKNSYAVTAVAVLWKRTKKWLAARDPAAAVVAERDASEIAYDQFRLDSPRWQAIDRSLTEINRLCKARRIPFVLFSIAGQGFSPKLLEGVAKREGFPLAHLNVHSDPRWAGQDERRFHNSVVDGHPSPLGNLALATLIAENLERHRAIGQH